MTILNDLFARRLRTRGLVPAAVCIALAAGAAQAQQPAGDADPLTGPRVVDRDMPGDGDTFGESKLAPREMRERPVGPRQYLRALRSLGEAEVDLALSPGQEDVIRGILEQHRADVQAYRDANAEQIAQLRDAAGLNDMRQRGPRGERGPRGQRGERGERPEPTPEQQAAREQLRALMQAGPSFEDAQAAVWAVLSAEQQAELSAELERLQAEAEQRRADRMMGRAGERPARRGGANNAGAGMGEPMEVAAAAAELAELNERLMQLPAEQRTRVLRMLGRVLDRAESGEAPRRNRFDRRGRGFGEGRGRGPGPDAPKRSVDDAEIPGADA
jgi:hypothetical protein